ncbi:MAG TPA: hypothetical protein VFH78_04565 [Candidatus Thermoplasmatota archaeon]|nr:hypothetical protein [Candidatus Thermoplasmatota archaeon]
MRTTSALLLAATLAGCAAAPPDVLAPGAVPETFEVIWLEPDAESPRPHAMEWDIAGATVVDGVTTIETTTRGVEGGDFRFTLRYRETDTPDSIRLQHDEALSRPGTFAFTYSEAIFWSGRDIAHVASVSSASFVDLPPIDGRERYHQGSFHLDFVGACGETCEGSGRTILEGRFLLRR